MYKKNPNWIELATSAIELGVASNVVMALRLAKLARGGPAAELESKLMISEKIAAAQKSWLMAAQEVSIAQAHKAPARAMAIYQERVSRNLRRLTRNV